VSKIIPFKRLARQQQLNFLEQKRREYRERQDYLARLRKLFFQIEAQMRQSEILQLELYRQAADHFHIPLNFPSLGDRLEMQRFFAENPFLFTLNEFLAGRLTPEECYRKILDLQGKPARPKK
jgi:hypothetical protein